MRTAISLALATFVSEDLAGISAGVLAAGGSIGYPIALGSYFAGIVLGDFLLFLLGRWMGRVARIRALVTRLVSDESLVRSARWIESRGVHVVMASRFLPGTRVATYVASGFIGVPPWRFLAYLALAAAVWTPLLVAAGALSTTQLAQLAADRRTGVPGVGVTGSGLTGFSLLAAGATLVGVSATLRVLTSVVRYRSRRAWVGRWRRLTHWEFWPMWCVYPPVVAYIAWLALKHRSLTTFTACNPGIVGGGFVGESKGDILRRVADVDVNVVPPYVVVPAAADAPSALRMADDHVERHGYPVVIKPDQGQRGEGVVIARTDTDLRNALAARTTDLILQRYVEGCEFGVFYYRRPHEPHGHIFAITEKRLQAVEGDGRRTLEQLILDHPRAVAMASHYFRANAQRLEWTPMAGEQVQLSELGVHSRGAIFFDGARLQTAALSAAIDRVARHIDGFYFGRFDVRSASREAFAAGEFAVIELNGVTSEATSIYDPRNSLWTAYRVLFAQWQLAFEIGRANVERGVAATPLTALFTLVRGYSARLRTQTDRERQMFPATASDVRFGQLAR